MAITVEMLEAKIREQAGQIVVLTMNADSYLAEAKEYLAENQKLKAELAALTGAPAKPNRAARRKAK